MNWFDNSDIVTGAQSALEKPNQGYETIDVPQWLRELDAGGFMIIEKPAYVNHFTDYAIEVPDRGVYSSLTGRVYTDADQVNGITDRGGADGALDSAKSRYLSMGCPEIADTLRIVYRTTTVSRGPFRPLLDNS